MGTWRQVRKWSRVWRFTRAKVWWKEWCVRVCGRPWAATPSKSCSSCLRPPQDLLHPSRLPLRPKPPRKGSVALARVVMVVMPGVCKNLARRGMLARLCLACKRQGLVRKGRLVAMQAAMPPPSPQPSPALSLGKLTPAVQITSLLEADLGTSG